MGNTKNKDELIPAPRVKKNKTNKNTELVGILLVFVFVSILYSTYVVYMGTQGWEPKVMLLPQAGAAAYLLFYKFTK
jgi:isoprenylcysteine carboxyl methyltransferase (ICMT) family protein YpbQ